MPRRGEAFELSPDIAKKVALIDMGDGAFEWRDAEPSRPFYVYRRDAGDVATHSATPLVVLPVEKLGENAIIARLAQWDRDLNPSDPERPLHRWDSLQRAAASGRRRARGRRLG